VTQLYAPARQTPIPERIGPPLGPGLKSVHMSVSTNRRESPPLLRYPIVHGIDCRLFRSATPAVLPEEFALDFQRDKNHRLPPNMLRHLLITTGSFRLRTKFTRGLTYAQ